MFICYIGYIDGEFKTLELFLYNKYVFVPLAQKGKLIIQIMLVSALAVGQTVTFLASVSQLVYPYFYTSFYDIHHKTIPFQL